ncbi:MAG: ATPase V [Deltaproteobacteria bacterium HGW-Deltaproteobacteria-15]|nr:MAG: ATPase V [Deltaproteobacteria bacterium HGW-Deltaproteobacteria-15]
MSIIPLQKVTFVGLAADKERLIDTLQEIGCLELISLNPGGERASQAGPSQREREALKFLLSCPQQRRQVRDRTPFDAAEIERQAIDLQHRIQGLEDERDFLTRRIADLKPWGDFAFPSLEEMGGWRLWFYVIPHREMKKVEPLPLAWEVVRRDQLSCYVVVVSEKEPAEMPVTRSHLGSRPRRELELRLEEVELAIEDAQAERAFLTRWSFLFARGLAQLEDKAARNEAAAQTCDQDPVFALQGWAPRETVSELREYAEKQGLMFEAEEPDPADDPPTMFRNPPALSAGEDLVTFYMTPGYRSWDPSSVVFVSFAVFFAMILSDAGYAALLGLGLLMFWKKMGRSETGRRFRPLGVVLVLVSIVYGILVASYFGISPPSGSFLASLHLIDMSNTPLMMAISVVIGAAHVVLANVMNGWRYGRRAQALPSLGWACIVAGGLVLGAAMVLKLEWLKYTAVAVMAAGVLLIVLFTGVGAKPVARLTQGFLGLTKVTSVFGDVLSYLRLFALGLATSSLAVSFNDMADQIYAGMPGIGIVFAIGILILGHVMNLVLGISSCVIHGLRLNVIEFFNWGLTEEGRLYKPFKRRRQEEWTH